LRLKEMPEKITDLRLTKAKIRNRILDRFKTEKEEDRNQKSQKIKKALLKNRAFKKAKIVMFYMSFGGEVDTAEMIKEAQKLGKTVVVPVCGRDRIMRPCALKEKGALLKGPYGILEPAIKKPLSLKSLNLVIVPGLAFDKKGRRLGRGKGYYDRFLSRIPEQMPTIGLAFAFQILPFVPTTTTDVDVKKVIFA
jgi:5-formyltetrahydrofolate cyclo-ligase